MPGPSFNPAREIQVIAPARLHMGFIDLGGALGRRFGSIGVGVNEIATRLTLSAADELHVEGPMAERALREAEKFAEATGTPPTVKIRIEQAIPDHVGLGSGTQLALAVGAGLARFHGLDLDIRKIANLIERGARSGIGIAVFEQGGFIVDGGRGPQTETPPVIARMDIPEAWRLILVFDQRGKGLHGRQEIEAFRALSPFPTQETARLCHLLLMQALPALAETDLKGFGDVITELQKSVGDHFAPAQGGRFTSPAVRDALAWLEAEGAVGIGQSSWGPTGFCLVESAAQGERLLAEAARRDRGLEFLVATARNSGAEITVEGEAPPLKRPGPVAATAQLAQRARS